MLVAAALISHPAAAADSHSYPRSLALYGGLRDGGSFSDVTSGNSIDIDGSGSFSASFDFPVNDQQLQLWFSYQDTKLSLDKLPPGPTPLLATDLPMHVMYLHVGGPVDFDGDPDRGGYVIGGLGVTLFDPASSGYSNELRASANVGIGFQQPLGDRFALRIEARGYFTLVNSSGGLFCSGGCVVEIEGNGVVQGDLSIGLAFRL